MGSNSTGTVSTGQTVGKNRDIPLVRLGNEDTTGFAKLTEQQGSLPGTFSKVSTAGRGEEGGNEGIVKRESFELSYNGREDV